MKIFPFSHNLREKHEATKTWEHSYGNSVSKSQGQRIKYVGTSMTNDEKKGRMENHPPGD